MSLNHSFYAEQEKNLPKEARIPYLENNSYLYGQAPPNRSYLTSHEKRVSPLCSKISPSRQDEINRLKIDEYNSLSAKSSKSAIIAIHSPMEMGEIRIDQRIHDKDLENAISPIAASHSPNNFPGDISGVAYIDRRIEEMDSKDIIPSPAPMPRPARALSIDERIDIDRRIMHKDAEQGVRATTRQGWNTPMDTFNQIKGKIDQLERELEVNIHSRSAYEQRSRSPKRQPLRRESPGRSPGRRDTPGRRSSRSPERSVDSRKSRRTTYSTSKYEHQGNPDSKYNTKSPYAKPTFAHKVRTMQNQSYTYHSKSEKKQYLNKSTMNSDRRRVRQNARKASNRFMKLVRDQRCQQKLFELLESYSAQFPDFAQKLDAILK